MINVQYAGPSCDVMNELHRKYHTLSMQDIIDTCWKDSVKAWKSNQTYGVWSKLLQIHITDLHGNANSFTLRGLP